MSEIDNFNAKINLRKNVLGEHKGSSKHDEVFIIVLKINALLLAGKQSRKIMFIYNTT